MGPDIHPHLFPLGGPLTVEGDSPTYEIGMAMAVVPVVSHVSRHLRRVG